MQFDIVVEPRGAHQVSPAAWLAAGLRVHGVESRIISNVQAPGAPFVACWGWRIGARLRAMGKTVLVMERGYVGDRFAWTSLGWDGLNGRARFPVVDDDGVRFRQHFPGALQERTDYPNGYVLLLGQVHGDAALGNVDVDGWYRRAASVFSGERVCFRPHPVEIQRSPRDYSKQLRAVEILGGTLQEALAGARCAVGYNSNSLTDALLAGVPCVACDQGAMAWPAAGHGLGSSPAAIDRDRWAHRLAWCQWSREEIESGLALDAVFGASHVAHPQFAVAV